MTPAEQIIRRQIGQTGPLTIAQFMQIALAHPEHGYYTTRDPLGAGGDFTTAPEISQMFGELIGLALAQAWSDQGAPARFLLAELGPGRGTLMADALRATARVPGFHEAAETWLVETSPKLRAAQAERLPGAHWAERLEDLPEAPLFLVANEFFDALPIRQFVREGEGWRERHVGLAHDRLSFGLGPPAKLAMLAHRLDDTRDGDLVEVCPQSSAIMSELNRRIAGLGGAALIIDYGDWRSLGDTLQALARHKRVHPLEKPGEADLTAHVDFEALARAAPSLKTSRLTAQGVFLERLGIAARAQALAAGLDGPRLTSHIAAHRRLTHPDEMGTLFKVMGFVPQDAPMLPGLET